MMDFSDSFKSSSRGLSKGSLVVHQSIAESEVADENARPCAGAGNNNSGRSRDSLSGNQTDLQAWVSKQLSSLQLEYRCSVDEVQALPASVLTTMNGLLNEVCA
jgi:hypothetical protein